MSDVSTIVRRPRSKLERVVEVLAAEHEVPSRPELGLPAHLALLVLIAAGCEPRAALPAVLAIAPSPFDPMRLASATAADLPAGVAGERVEPALAGLHAIARLAAELGDLTDACAGDAAEARAILRAIPGLAAHHRDLALLYAGLQPVVAPTAPAMHVAVRLGYPGADYGAIARALDAEIDSPDAVRVAWRAHQLLDRHGRNVCTAELPRCASCAVRDACAFHGDGDDPSLRITRASSMKPAALSPSDDKG